MSSTPNLADAAVGRFASERAMLRKLFDTAVSSVSAAQVMPRGERSQPRYAYDRGRLEIMVSSYEHENLKHDLATLVEVIAEELEIDIVGAASTIPGARLLSPVPGPVVC